MKLTLSTSHNRAGGLSSVCRSTYACLMAAAPVSTTSVSKITRPAPWKEASEKEAWLKEAKRSGIG